MKGFHMVNIDDARFIEVLTEKIHGQCAENVIGSINFIANIIILLLLVSLLIIFIFT